MKFSGVAGFVLVVLLLVSPTMAAIRCRDVFTDLGSCLAYVVGGTSQPSTACCNGAAKLVSAAPTVSDRKAACTCLVSAAQNAVTNAAAVVALPGSCGITLPFPVSVNIDCSTIS